MEERSSLWQSLILESRALHALLMREIITRYGRHNIGFLWLMIEPAMFCTGVMLIRVSMHESSRSLPILAFIFTGYSTVLLWRNTGNRCACAITPNLGLLYHRNVRAIDVLLSRITLELAGCAMSFLVLMSFCIFTGLMQPPHNWGLLMFGYIMEAWFAASLAIWVCGATELSEVWDRIWHPLTYFMLPISGLGFMIDWLPLKWQRIAEMVPMWAALEIMRDGYFGNLVRCHYSILYLTTVNLVLMLTGMILIKIYCRTAEPG